MRVFVTGGTGLIGKRLVHQLSERQDQVVLLTRRPAAAKEQLGSNYTILEGDPMQTGSWMDVAADCDAVVNLAGENLFGRRWSPAFKTLLHESRVQSTTHVVQALARKPLTASGRPKVLVNASAVGWYGPRGDEEITEKSGPGDDFLARLCADWETAARAAEPHGVRVVLIRTGVVLAPDGGALAQLLLPFKMGLGGPAGSGRQWMSWIHSADVVGIILLALDHAEAQGPINATAPNPATNKDFGKALGRALHRPAFMPTPAFALRVILGQVAEVVTTGQRVLPRRAEALGYRFQHPQIDGALREILERGTKDAQ